jgi:hypothetical protein
MLGSMTSERDNARVTRDARVLLVVSCFFSDFLILEEMPGRAYDWDRERLNLCCVFTR